MPVARRLVVTLALVAATLLVAACGSTRAIEREDAVRSEKLAAAVMEESLTAPNEIAAELRRQLLDLDTLGTGVDPILFDAYLAAVPPEEGDLGILTTAFLGIVGSAHAYTDALQRVAASRHVVLTELLSSPSASVSDAPERSEAALRWWMTQDDTPARRGNERLLLHLERLAAARAEFGSHTSLSGLDERGHTFIRYGEPARRRPLSLRQGDLLRAFQYDGIAVSGSDFPEAEFWTYDHIYNGGIYLFVASRPGEGHRLGEVSDLIPRQLRHRGLTGSARGGALAFAALRTMRHIYGELALYHPAYSGRYETVSNFVGWHEERAIGRRSGGEGAGAVMSFDAATRTYASALQRSEREDARIAERRAVAMPHQFAASQTVALPVEGRTVRFLDESRATRLSVYWRPDVRTIPEECADRLRLNTYSWHAQAVAFHTATIEGDVVFESITEGSVVNDQVRRIDFVPPKGTYSAALQIDQIASAKTTDGREVTRTCTGVVRAEKAGSLFEPGQSVAVSDLLPFRVDDVVESRERLRSDFSVDGLSVFVQDDLRAEPALGIYFEVYSLQDLNDDFILEYQVVKRSRGTLLQRSRTRASIYQASRAAFAERLPAAFLIDQAEWEGADEIDVSVTATNISTGEEVTRTVRFQVGS